MKLPKEDLEGAIRKSKRLASARKRVRTLEEKIASSVREKSGNTDKISKCNTEIRQLQGEIRRLGVLCQGINRRIGVFEGKIQKHNNSIKKEQKRIEQRLEDRWVEKKRQEFRKNCYVRNLNI